MTITINVPVEKPIAAVKAVKKNIVMFALQTKLQYQVARYDIPGAINTSKKIIAL